MNDQFASQRDLGKVFDKSSHVVGRWLVALGLRMRGSNDKFMPTSAAFNGGFVKQAGSGRNNGTFFYVWHREKTLAALSKAGHQPVVAEETTNQPVVDRLVGPFELRSNGARGYEIVGSDGAVAAWVRGERNATKLKALLNLAFKHGNFN